jgi:hypothetical protein
MQGRFFSWLFLLAIIILPVQGVWAADCATLNQPPSATNSSAECGKIGPGMSSSAIVAETAAGDAKCFYIDNLSTDKTYFIPFKTGAEWDNTIANLPADLRAFPCCPPDATVTVCGVTTGIGYSTDGTPLYPRAGTTAVITLSGTPMQDYQCGVDGRWAAVLPQRGTCPRGGGH